MSSATAPLVDDLAHHDALGVRTHLAAGLAAASATIIAAATAVHGRPPVVRRVREAFSLTVQVVELRRAR
jgi:hypothetical protein